MGVIVLMGEERGCFARAFSNHFVTHLSSQIEHAPISAASIWEGHGAKRQLVSVARDPHINAMLPAEPADQ